jgi:hypothetical protein
MGSLMAITIGLALTSPGWLLPRAVARTPFRASGALIADAALPFFLFALLAVATSRPIFSGIMVLALGAGFAFADRAKRMTLGEPVLFTDFFQTFDILRHPKICLIFLHPFATAAAAAAAAVTCAILLEAEPASLHVPFTAFACVLIAGAFLFWFARRQWTTFLADCASRAGLTAKPVIDARLVGPIAMQFAYGFLAHAQRKGLQAKVAPAAATLVRLSDAGPVVMIQCESFFDPRPMHETIPRDLLPAFDACRAASRQWGQLTVPARGANTVRTEFAALTGLALAAAGFDRFNPYHRFADAKISSLVWSLHASGYKTICIHPFDRRFYRRNRVLANLGFDEFLGEEAFEGAQRNGHYVADVEIANLAVKLIRRHGPKVFIFAITMENHGPWPVEAVDSELCTELPDIPEKASLGKFLKRLQGADRMIEILTQTMQARDDNGILAFYGDHLPNFNHAYGALGYRDRRTPYFIWQPEAVSGFRRDIAAHELGAAICNAHQTHSAMPLHDRIPLESTN